MEEIKLENVKKPEINVDKEVHVEEYSYSDDHEVKEKKNFFVQFIPTINLGNLKFNKFKIIFNWRF